MTQEQENRLVEMTTADAEYQALLRQCTALESEYRRILDCLPQPDREILEHDIGLCEELEYRRTHLAMEINKAALG